MLFTGRMHDQRAKTTLRMQRPTDQLRREHATIVQAVRVLSAMGGAVAAGAPFPAPDCAVVIRFLREFVLTTHLAKEAATVCPAVAMHGDDVAAGVVGEVLRLHEEVSELVCSLMWFWEPSDLSAPEREGFATTVIALVRRLERLHELEEGHLFPSAEAIVPADDRLEWLHAFAEDSLERGVDRWCPQVAALAAVWVH
jgi:hemerythrin-like domain-containing protein